MTELIRNRLLDLDGAIATTYKGEEAVLLDYGTSFIVTYEGGMYTCRMFVMHDFDIQIDSFDTISFDNLISFIQKKLDRVNRDCSANYHVRMGFAKEYRKLFGILTHIENVEIYDGLWWGMKALKLQIGILAFMIRISEGGLFWVDEYEPNEIEEGLEFESVAFGTQEEALGFIKREIDEANASDNLSMELKIV